MDFTINENQKMIADMIQQFGKQNITPFVREWDDTQTFPVQVFKKLGELGLMGVLVPTEYGGSGFSYTEYVTAIEQLSILDPSIGLSMAAHNSASQHCRATDLFRRRSVWKYLTRQDSHPAGLTLDWGFRTCLWGRKQQSTDCLDMSKSHLWRPACGPVAPSGRGAMI